VTRRTINRDIESLCQAGIPIITYQGAGGGISVAEGFDISQGAVIDLFSYYKSSLSKKVEQVKRAAKESRLIEFDYIYEKGESHRRIEPYFATYQWSAWYVFGFCTKRQDWRMFKLLRTRNLTACADRFVPRDVPPERREFGGHFRSNINLVALLEPSEKYKLIEMYGFDCYTETPDGLLIRIGFTNRDFLLTWLLGFGGKVKVLEPLDIAEEVQAEARKILANYET